MEKYIQLKSSSTTLVITRYVSFSLMCLSALIWHKTKSQELMGMIIAFGLIFSLSLLIEFIVYIINYKKY